jgi:hypothetical protein
MDEPDASSQIICPNCGAPIALPANDGENPSVHCQYCEADFVPGANEESEETQDAAVEWEQPANLETELDSMRIRKVIQLRRSAIRARTYAIVVLICCLVMAAQLILTDFQEVGLYGWDRWAILYAISGGALVIIATIASYKAKAFHIESNISSQIDSEHAPHFDALSDGSQRVKNLERMIGGAETRE